MERDLLRKVQLTQLEILEEVVRVCDKNDIKYFLEFGTLLGAVRHKGFIPWDDDLDIGMLRSEYDKFCKIALEELHPQYFLQTWYTDKGYALPFGKIRKKGTVFVEGKSERLQENGIYIDIFPYDNTPKDLEKAKQLKHDLCELQRLMLMKCNYKPWYDDGKINWKKRIGYIFYQLQSWFMSYEKIRDKYEKLVREVEENDEVYTQNGLNIHRFTNKSWYDETVKVSFEGEEFCAPKEWDKHLKKLYGDYHVLPPENQRENRHQIVELSFGD